MSKKTSKKLTAREACNECPLVGSLYEDCLSSRQGDIDRWFHWLRGRLAMEIAVEKTAEIERLSAELEDVRKREVVAANNCYSERARAEKAEARVRELEAASVATTPKTWRTGGQKARQSLESHVRRNLDDICDDEFQAFAKEWGIPDDPPPPTDGELMRKAYANVMGTCAWYEGALSDMAAEFLRLRAERDGGEA